MLFEIYVRDFLAWMGFVCSLVDVKGFFTFGPKILKIIYFLKVVLEKSLNQVHSQWGFGYKSLVTENFLHLVRVFKKNPKNGTIPLENLLAIPFHLQIKSQSSHKSLILISTLSKLEKQFFHNRQSKHDFHVSLIFYA